MKKLSLITLTIICSLSLAAQQRVPVSKEYQKFSKSWEHKQQRDVLSPVLQFTAAPYSTAPTHFKDSRFIETPIMQTKYDLQSNKALANRIIAWPDGSAAVVETRGMNDPNYADRGTAYNYFNGTSWQPMPSNRIESEKTGWPSIAPWGTNGEINVAHLNEGMRICVRENKGEGTWQEYTQFGPPEVPWLSWVRTVASGENNEYTHYFVNTYDPYLGQTEAMLYCRSSDGGQTLDIDHELIDEISLSYYTEIAGDIYAMASKGNNVVLLVGDSWTDLFLLKSTDNGENWNKTVIWEHPYPFFDWNTTITTDTLYAPDGSLSVALDNNGMAHVVFAITRVAHFETGTTYSIWPYTDGIGYWDEYMEPIPVADNPHHTLSPENLDALGLLVGWTQDVNGNGEIEIYDLSLMTYPSIGVSTMPTISIDNNNVIMIAYASTTEGFDNTIYYYKHIWTRYSPDNGNSWSDFRDLDSDITHIFDECIYPVLAQDAWNAKYHLIYNIDQEPGLSQDPGGAAHDPTVNTMMHIYFDDLVGKMDQPKVSTSIQILVSPNPVRTSAELKFSAGEATVGNLKVYNTMGQIVLEQDGINIKQGVNALRINLSAWERGVYLANIAVGNAIYSGKIILE